MKLHQVRDVVAVAERGSLRAASRHLGLAQSAITRSIRQLERELGTALFERRKRGAVLTPMGALFLRRARSAVSELSRAREEIQQHQGGLAGTVVACLSTTPHIALLPSVLPPFRKRYPEVRLHITEGVVYQSVEPRLKDGSFDFYVGMAPAERPSQGLITEELFLNPRAVVGRAQHPLSDATSLADLVEADWVISGRDGAESELANLFLRHKLAAPTRISIGDTALSLMVLLAYTDSLAIVPRQWTGFAPTRALLQEISIKEDLHGTRNVLIRRADMPLTPAAEYLCELLRRAGSVRQAPDAAPRRRAKRRRV